MSNKQNPNAWGYIDEQGHPIAYKNEAHKREMKDCVELGGFVELFTADAVLRDVAELVNMARDFDNFLSMLGMHCNCQQSDCNTTRLRTVLQKNKGVL